MCRLEIIQDTQIEIAIKSTHTQRETLVKMS